MYLDFEYYLQKLGVNSKSIKNYKSDISHFFAWAKNKLKNVGAYVESLPELSPFLNKQFISEYLSDMALKSLPRKTVNRRLSTLRHLSKHLVAIQVIETDFMEGIQNLGSEKPKVKVGLSDHPSIEEFRSYLEAEKVSKNTIKNYLSDIKQFLSWLENNYHAHTS